MAQIVFDHVTKIFEPDELVLEEISFRIEKGEFVFLIGKSGVGKSSILKLLSEEDLELCRRICVVSETGMCMTISFW